MTSDAGCLVPASAGEVPTTHHTRHAPGVGDMAETETLIEKSTSSEELAYMLLEEARLRCHALLADSADGFSGSTAGFYVDPDGLSLNGLYGDLGIAGYYASARLDPARRRQLLAQAHNRAERGDPASVRALADVTAAATRTVERALTITGLLDHMHIAHIHVMSACEALDAMFAVQA